MSIEFLLVLIAVAGIWFGALGKRLPQLRNSQASASNTTTSVVTRMGGGIRQLTPLPLAMIILAFIAITYYLSPYLGLSSFVRSLALWTGIALLIIGFFYGSTLIKVLSVMLLLFAWLGPERSERVVTRVDTLADKATNLVGVPKTPAQIVAERQAEVAKMKRQQELAKIQAEGEERTRVAAENAAARALEESMMNANAVPCVRLYKDQPNCTTVTFGYHTKYERTDAIDHCAVIDPKDVVTEISLGGNQWRYTGPPGLVVQFFDVPLGKPMPSGKKCGE